MNFFKDDFIWAEFDEETAMIDQHYEETTLEVEMEAKKFLTHPFVPRSLDPLQWWATTGKNAFPLIYDIAMKYLFIPATSTPCERVFSSAGIILNEKRSALSDENARALVFLHENLK